MKKNFSDILRTIGETDRKKYEAKLPSWASAGAQVPSGLSLEQCSSEAAACYKAELMLRGGRPETVVDLTCGMGVDSLAFSQAAGRVIAFERNPKLAEATRHNFQLMGADRIELRCEEVTPETDIPVCDFLFADPARRDAAGRKVFLLEDCSPDILTLLPTLCSKAGRMMFKLSPMADITMVARRLQTALQELPNSGFSLQEVHVTSLGGEVKELLCLLGKDGEDSDGGHADAFPITVRELSGGGPFVFRQPEENAARARMLSGEDKLLSATHIVEPSAAILKAGAFKLPSERFEILKADPMTHLYFTDAATAGQLPGKLFRAFPIREIVPFGKATMRDVAHRFPHSSISARNFPLSSDELRKKMGVSSGSDARIFAFSALGKRWLAIT